jgi:hypothetical protein
VPCGRSTAAAFLFYILLDGHFGLCNTFWQADGEDATSPPALTRATEMAMAQADSITTATGEACLSEGRQSPQVCGRRTLNRLAALGGKPTSLIESEGLDSRVEYLESRASPLGDGIYQRHRSGCSLNRKHLFVDLRSETVAVIRNAPKELRNHDNWKVS